MRFFGHMICRISLHRLKIGIYKGARFLILRTQRTLSFYQLFHIGSVGWERDPETWPFFLHFLTFIARYKKRSIFVCNQMFSTNNSENNFSQSKYSLPHWIFYSIQVICSYRTVKSKISWKDSIPLKLPQIWFQGTQISLVYSKYEFGGQVVALDFGDKKCRFLPIPYISGPKFIRYSYFIFWRGFRIYTQIFDI